MDSPLRISASFPTADALLNFSATTLNSGDGSKKVVSPTKKQIFNLASSTINFQTQSLSIPSNFDITFPTSTVSYYRYVGFTLIGSGKIKAIFSSENASLSALSNPGSLFVSGGLPIGYVALRCTNALGYFKTADSSSDIIEASNIYRLAAGGGASSASGSGSAGGELADLMYYAAMRDSFSDIPDGTTTIDIAAGKTDALLHDVANELFKLNYDASKTLTGTGTAMALSAAVTQFTPKAGDILVFNNEAKKITTWTSFSNFVIESAFATNPSTSACNISQAIHTVDLNNFTAGGTGLSAASQFSGNIDEVMLGYADTTTLSDIIPDFGTAPVIAFTASSDNTSYTNTKVRQTSLSSSESVTLLPTSGTNLYLRFFANKTTGSGTVNLLSYKVFFQKQIGQTAGGTYYTAFARPTSSIAQNCTHSVVSGKSRFTFTFSFTRGLNSTEASGSILEVIANGQIVPRFTTGITNNAQAYFTEISDSIIEMDTDYSLAGANFQFKVQRMNIIDTNTQNTTRISENTTTISENTTTISSNTTRISALEALIPTLGTGGSGVGSVDIMSADQADSSKLTDYTQTGLELVTTPIVLHGTQSFRLQHATSIKSFKKVIAVDRKFRGKNHTLSLDVISSATSGNLNILFRDETNSANIGVSQSIATGSQAITATAVSTASLTGMSTATFNLLKVGMLITGLNIPVGTTIIALNSTTLTATMSAASTGTASGIRISNIITKKSFSFDIPNNCLSLSWTISSVVEVSTESYVDDIVIALTATALTSTSISQTTFNATDWTAYTPTFTGFGTPTAVEFEYRQNGQNYDIRGKFASGVSTAVEARISLPLAATSAGTGVIPSIQAAGFGGLSSAAASQFIPLIEPSVGYITLGTQSSGAGGLTKQNASTLISSGQSLSIFASVPIAGLTTSTTTSTTIPLTTAQLVQTPDSTLRLSLGNGYGSTNTKIKRFTNIISNIGSDIQYLDSATLGGSFIAATAGTYSFEYTDQFSGLNWLGLSLNTTTPTTSIFSIAAAEILAIASAQVTNAAATVTWTGYLNAGDVVRAHTDGATTGTVPASCQITISKQGSLKQLNPSSDAKITIPTHSLRFEGASALGSTDTAIVKFDTQAITQGDGFSIVNTAANGTVITMLKAGKLDISASLQKAISNTNIMITKNQTVRTALSTIASEIVVSSQSNNAVAEDINISGAIQVAIGDIIRVSSNTTPTADTSNVLNLLLTEASIPANFSNVLPQWSQSDSSVQLNTANGFGSTNTVIRRFSNTVDNFGTSVTYTDSATAGSSFLINEDGIYEISYTDNNTTASVIGLSRNSTQLTTAINSISVANRLAESSVNVNSVDNVCWTGYLTKNDIIRPHSTGVTAVDVTGTHFSISKVGKPNLTSVDVTPFVNMKTTDVEAIEFANSSTTFGSTATAVPVLSATKNTNLGVIQVISDGVNGTSFKALKDCEFKLTGSFESATASSTSKLFITKNATLLTTASADGVLTGSSVAVANGQTQIAITIKVLANDVIRIQRNNTNVTVIDTLFITATADNNATASPTQQVSSDTMTFAFKATAIDPNVDPIGTFNTYTYAANSGTAVISASAPTQTTASMNLNGINFFSRAPASATTTGNPARVDVFIGKGLKSKQVDSYAALAKATPITLDHFIPNTTTENGCYVVYSEITGILSIDAGVYYGAAFTNRTVGFDNAGNGYTNGYLVFNASKAPILTTIPAQQQVSFSANTSTTAATVTQNFIYTVVDHNILGGYSTITGKFTAPIAGKYHFTSISYAGATAYNPFLRKNGTNIAEGTISSNATPATVSHTLSLAAGDVIDIIPSGSATASGGAVLNIFSGFLIK